MVRIRRIIKALHGLLRINIYLFSRKLPNIPLINIAKPIAVIITIISLFISFFPKTKKQKNDLQVPQKLLRKEIKKKPPRNPLFFPLWFLPKQKSCQYVLYRTSLDGARLNKNPFTNRPALAEKVVKRFDHLLSW